MLINHTDQSTILFSDNALLTEEIDGESNGQQGYDGNGKTDNMQTLGFGLLLLNLQLLFLCMIACGIVVGLAAVQAVADDLRKGSITGLIVKSLCDTTFGTGSNGTGTEDNGIVVIQRVGSHATRHFVIGSQGFVVHTQGYLCGSYHATAHKGLAITAIVKEGEVFTGLLSVRRGVGTSQKSPCLSTAEVQIAVTVVRVVAPRQAITVFLVLLGMLFVVIQTVKDALSQGDDLSKAVQVVEGINLTLHGNDEGIHAVNTAWTVKATDGIVELVKALVNLP